MKSPPCEYVIWNILPSIRKEFAKSLIEIYGLNQKQAAEILGVTPAAICYYLSNKRGGIDITNEGILNEIDKSAKLIYKNRGKEVTRETCRICRLIKSSGKTSMVKKNAGEIDVSPCENKLWKILPLARKEFTKILIEKHGYTHKQAADELDITEAAVSRYLSGKRGKKEIQDEILRKELEKSIQNIIDGNNDILIKETCRICTLLGKKLEEGE